MLYSEDGPFQFMHVDIANLGFLGKSGTTSRNALSKLTYILQNPIKIYEPILHWPMLKYATTKNEPKQPKKNKTSQNKPKGDLK